MEYKVKTEVFEGPLDLLLSLIEKRKLFINDISLAAVTDDFIAYIKHSGGLPLSQTAHFVLVASTLLLIKSKSLLPTLNLTEEEEGSMEDLERRLVLYQRFKALAQNLKEHFGARIIFRKRRKRMQEPLFSPDKDISVTSLHESAKNVLHNLPALSFETSAMVKKVISLEEMIDNLTSRIQKSMKLSFREFSNMDKGERVHVVVSFLAMLELVKQDLIAVEQNEQFGDIHLHNRLVSRPHYGT